MTPSVRAVLYAACGLSVAANAYEIQGHRFCVELRGALFKLCKIVGGRRRQGNFSCQFLRRLNTACNGCTLRTA